MSLQNSSEEILNQLIELIDNMEPAQYESPVDALSKSSIGAHVRHIVEFYECLLKGHETGLVNYDARVRNYILETDMYYAVQVLLLIIQKVNAIKKDKMLMISLDLSAQNNPIVIDTTFLRELAYNVEHAIHHMAIIKIGVTTAYPQVRVEKNFGVAYSTVKFKKQVCVQ
ncbi:MAG: hypothetical protein ABI723_07835 [Bacteroidia bacterium]